MRKILIANELAATLKLWKLQCPATADNLVFPAADCRPIRRSNALRYGLGLPSGARDCAALTCIPCVTASRAR